MNMIQLDFRQGSQEWLDNRLHAWNASEAPVMMGCHPNMTRDELLEAKATCNPKQYSDFVEKRVFAKGHETEALARPLVEEDIGEELYPVSGKNGKLQASFDGLTLMQDTGFEHKQWNAELAILVAAGKPPAYIFWQLEHQLAVCPDLERIILVVSDGTRSNWVQMDYRAVKGRREQLLAAWEQFDKDWAGFKATEKKVEPSGVRPDSLPALFVDVAGALTTSSNLAEFRAGAELLIGSIKTELVSDQDFADAEAAIKWLDEHEKKIDAAIEQAMSRTGPLEELVRTLKDVQQNLMRSTRLKLNKQVDAQKLNRRNQIVADAKTAFEAFLDSTNAEFKPVNVSIVDVTVDFYQVIKGKRSFDNMVSACNDALASKKIEINEIAGRLRKNLATLKDYATYDFLFSNKQVMAYMQPDHLQLTIDAKIREYEDKLKADDQKRIDGHKQTIAKINAAGEPPEDMPLASLRATKDRIAGINCATLEEFADEAEKAQHKTLTALNERIAAAAAEENRLREAREAKAKQEQIPQPAVQPAAREPEPAQTYSIGNSVSIHAGEQQRVTQPMDKRPDDLEIVQVVASHYGIDLQEAVVWLRGVDLDALADRLEDAA